MSKIQEIKGCIPPENYYNENLAGAFGKHTGNGWHKWNGLCPFHADKRAGSLVINKMSGAFKCFSCGVNGGDIIDFHMKANGLSFKDAFKELRGEVQCAK